MLTIRKEQLLPFQRSLDTTFIRSLMRHLRRAHPKAVAHHDDGELEREVARGLERAAGHGLVSKRSLALFVGAMFESDPDFATHPDVTKYLTLEGIPPDARIVLALASITDAQWEDIIRDCTRKRAEREG